MRAAYCLVHCAIFTIPPGEIDWLPPRPKKAVFIPIGSHFPECKSSRAPTADKGSRPSTVAVFGITGSGHASQEVADIAHAVVRARKQIGRVRLLVMGRGTDDARVALETALAGHDVDLSTSGVLPESAIAANLATADVLLFVRGPVSPQRSSAIAGIACGLPVVGYVSDATCFPITEAGLQLAPLGDREALAVALCRVLTDACLWNTLHERSSYACRNYFSWDAIARRYAAILHHA